MKNFFKNLSFFLIALIIILVSLYFFLVQKKIITINYPVIENKVNQPNPLASTTSFAQDPMGTYTTMTNDERIKLRLPPDLKVEVIRRSASGTPTDYRIVK
jgi:hypothetical protein